MLAELLEQLQTWIVEVIRTTQYVGIAILMLIENLFPPIPSEIVLPFSGFLVRDGTLTFWIVLAASTAGAMAGAGIIYAVGTRMTEPGVRRWVNNYGKWLLLQEKDIDRLVTLFDKHGRAVVFFGRFVPGLRSLISLPAGLQRMSLPIFILYTLIGTLIWNSMLIGGGVLLNNNWQRILGWIDKYEMALWVIVGMWVVYRLYQLITHNSADNAARETQQL